MPLPKLVFTILEFMVICKYIIKWNIELYLHFYFTWEKNERSFDNFF